MTDLRTTAQMALEQGEQEQEPELKLKPQAHMLITEQGVCGGVFRFRYDAEVAAREGNGKFSIVPLYTAPPQPKQQPVAWNSVPSLAYPELNKQRG